MKQKVNSIAIGFGKTGFYIKENNINLGAKLDYFDATNANKLLRNRYFYSHQVN